MKRLVFVLFILMSLFWISVDHQKESLGHGNIKAAGFEIDELMDDLGDQVVKEEERDKKFGSVMMLSRKMSEPDKKHQLRQGRANDGAQMKLQLKNIESRLDQLNFPDSSVRGHLTEDERREVRALVLEMERIKTSLFENRLAQIMKENRS